MEFDKKLGYFLQNYGCPFIVGSLVSEKVLFVNKIATELFGITPENCDLPKIFDTTPERIASLMKKTVESNKPTLVYNYTVITKDQEKILVDLQVGYFDEDKKEVFLEIIPQRDNLLKMALHQVQNSHRAEAILHMDETLSILECNQAFRRVFQSNEEIAQAMDTMELSHGFHPNSRAKLLQEIHCCLKTESYFSRDLVIQNSQGEDTWYRFELEKRDMGNCGTKLLCYLMNIQGEVERKEKNYLLNQYLSVVQDSSVDILYRVDIKENTMYHYSNFVEVGEVGKEISDYVSVFLSGNIIHPDDRALYMKGFQEFYDNDQQPSQPIRFSFDGGEYRWYKISAKKIFDSKGNLKEVFGALINVEKEVHMEAEVSAISHYLEAFQAVSNESFYIINLEKKTLTQKGSAAKELGVEGVMEHFPDCTFDFVHPEDLSKYQAFTQKSLEGEVIRVEVRLKLLQGDYEWYEICSQGIKEADGTMGELVGKMNNIHKTRTMQAKVSSLSKYLESIQTLSGESLYYVDLKTRILRQKGDVALELGLPDEIPNYPEGAYDFIHPEDLDNYKFFARCTLSGQGSAVQVRFATVSGEYQWYEIISKPICDDSGEMVEIFGRMSNVHKGKTMQNQFIDQNKYFQAMQTFSSDVLYRIDVATMTLHHSLQTQRVLLKDNAVPDYLNTLTREKIVHPDDVEHYLAANEAWVLDETVVTEVRFALISEEYQWYRVKGKKILDDQGNLVEVVGVLMNIQAEKNMETEVSLLTQYFDCMQSLSDESIYVFDLDTRLLHLGGLTESELGLPLTMEGYPESLFPLTHPEDLESLKQFASRALDTKESRMELRLRNIDDSYQWYELVSNVIYGKNAVPTKILGKVRNIQKEKTTQAEVTTMSKYFDAMQEFSSDILYRIDIKTQTLYHAYNSQRAIGVGLVVENYLETVVKDKYVHPEDAELYLQKSKEWMEDESVECEVRFNLVNGEYEWYSIKRRKIFDENGKLVEILGALVSTQKERELTQQFEDSSKYFKIMQELSDDIFYRVEVDTLTLHHNFESTQPITQNKVIPDYVNTFIQEKIVHPDDVEQYLKDLQAFEEGSVIDVVARFALHSEEYHWYKARARKIYDENGKVVEYWGRLMSENKVRLAQEELSEVNQYFNAMQNLSDDILFQVDIATKTFRHNDQNALDFGVPKEIPNYVEMFIENNFIPKEDADMYRSYTNKLFSGESMEYQVRAAVAVGVYEWFDVRCEHIYAPDGEPVEIFGRMRNIQKQKNLELRAYHDMMTGALNKTTFEEEVAGILQNSLVTNTGEKHALIFIDLDDFKSVNDNLGHSYGDVLLTTVGKRLKRLVRGEDLVGRIGGDEFSVFLRNVNNEESVLVRTKLMLESLQRNFSFEGKVIAIKASVGVGMFPEHGQNYKDLIGKSDMAVYESKRRGKNTVTLYTSKLEEY